MKEFDVTITETLKLTVSVEASSKEEAQQMVSDQWHAGDHILDADNFVEVEFESNDGKEISAERAPDDTIEVLMVEPGQYPRVERIGSDLASLQKAVDGYIEAIYPYDDPVALICGEEAKLEGKPLNRALRDEDGDIYDIVAGKFFLCGLGDENFASLPKELQQKYEEKFRQPEAFLKMGSKIMAIPTEPAKAAGKGKTAQMPERRYHHSQCERKEEKLMQEEIENRTVTLIISAVKLTARELKAGMDKYLSEKKSKAMEKARAAPEKPSGKQTVRQLIGQNQGVSNIEITNSNIKGFERIARKYGVDFAVKKDRSVSPPKYFVFFKARDADALTAAFKEYTAYELKRAAKAQNRPSVLAHLQALKAKVQAITPGKSRNQNRGITI